MSSLMQLQIKLAPPTYAEKPHKSVLVASLQPMPWPNTFS